MAAGEPRVLIDNATKPVAEFVIGAFPQRPERPRRGHDRVVMDAVAGADLGNPVGHAGAAGDAVDQAPGAFEHAVQHPLGGRHLPQHVHVDAAFAVAALIGDAGLLDAAGDRIGNQLFVPLAPGAAAIKLRDQLALRAIAVGVDPREGADPAGRRPGARAFAVRHRDALAAFDQRQHLAPRDHQRIERPHQRAPCRSAASQPGPGDAGREAPPAAPASTISGTSENTEATPQANSSRARAASLTV